MAYRIGWRALLAGAAVVLTALAFVQVVADGNRHSDLRQRARSVLDAEVAACESPPSHEDRAFCRASLLPMPRDSASLAAWTPRGP